MLDQARKPVGTDFQGGHQLVKSLSNGGLSAYNRPMFDITGDDIAQLNDTDLRTLVARLAIAELAIRKLPTSPVTAGGHQDAKDGGIDVRVDLDVPLVAPDFVPRAKTGFQVKKQDMPVRSIAVEMRPKGVPRPAIAALADAEGAYIIVSAQGSVTDTALAKRRQAMRDALDGHPKAAALFTDFYDRERLANWVNHFPGVGAWVRSKIGGAVTGWRPIGKWADTDIAADGGYLVDEAACLIDERSKDAKTLSIVDGIALLRTSLAAPRQCVRLIGMSGLGKTRLAQALFEPGVGENPLDPALSVYTDYSDGTGITPPAREIARRLVDSGQRAILVVDNCNPVTHSELVIVCGSAGSNVSLLTIEYDVRDDEPERTEVFRLTSASNSLITNWIERDFPHVSQVDRGRIAEFSDGNFRIARALAETLRRGETLGQLRDRQLFERIFIQRNAPDNQLFHDAEVLALLYSFDGEDESAGGELARLAEFGERTVRALFGSIADLRRRGIIQSRGRWRAVLPQAIANPLAVDALKRLPQGDFDAFCGALPPRMLKSLSRRIGYLHDSEVVQAAVARWLNPDGALGDLIVAGEKGLAILRNIAPVLPEPVLTKIMAELDGENGPLILALSNPQRWQWISLLKSLAYEPAMFERAATLLARFVMAEPPDHHNNSATGSFDELFQLYLSGTMAPPEQRRNLARKLLESPDESLLRAGMRALGSLLKTGHFSSTSTFDFGARPRNFGWHPKINGDVYSWYNEAINLAVDLASRCEETKAILGHNVRGLWQFAACHDALDVASQRLASTGWVDGWIGFRAALRFHGKGMPDDIRDRLVAIIERLKPADLLNRARAFVLSRSHGGDDVADGEDDAVTAWHRASQAAVEVGKAMSADRSLVIAFLPEVIVQNPPRVFEFGRGLAQGTDDLATLWADLQAAYRAAPADTRNATLLGGFIAEAHILDRNFVGSALDAIARDSDLGRLLPYFQARAALDEGGLDRLRTAIPLGLLKASDFACLASGVIKEAPAAPLISMFEELVGLDKGVGEALFILHMRFHCSKDEERAIPDELLIYGRELLKRTDFGDVREMRDFGMRIVVERCLVGSAAADDARIVCRNLRVAIEEYRASASDANDLLEGLFKTQPEVALDCFLLNGPPPRNDHLFDFGFIRESPVESLDAATLAAWADKDPADRYPRLGDVLSLFTLGNMEEATDLSPLFLDLMNRAPDKARFLGDGDRSLSSSGWSGSLADVLEKRRAILAPLANYPDPGVKAWFQIQNAGLDDRIAAARLGESRREESFE